jgi:hypothetical protein
MSQEKALICGRNSEQAIDGVYRDLVITSADSASGKMEGHLNSFGPETEKLKGSMHDMWFHYDVPSESSTVKFKVGAAQFMLKADDRTFSRLYGEVTFEDGSVEACAFKKPFP